MPIPGSGQVSLSDLYDEYTGTHDSQEIQLSDYHDEGNAPASGDIQLAADFHGTSAAINYRSHTFTADGTFVVSALSANPDCPNARLFNSCWWWRWW